MMTRQPMTGGFQVLAIAFPLLLLLHPAPSIQAGEYSEEFSRVVPFTAGGKVTIETHGGSVVFSGSDATDVVIEATRTVEADSPEEAERILSELTTDVRVAGSKLEIETIYPHEKRGLLERIFGEITHDYGSVDYVIALPRQTDVRVDATSTYVRGTDIEGRVSVDLSSGDVDLERIDGIVYVDGTSGNIMVQNIGADLSVDNTSGNVTAALIAGSVEIDKTSGLVTLEHAGGNFLLDGTSCEVRAVGIAGDAEIDVTSGDVVIEGLGGSIVFEGTSGDLTVEFARGPAGACEINTSSGDVELVTGEDPDFDLLIETSSGRISARLPGMEISEISSEGLEAVIGAGGEVVLVETTSGDVTVRQK